MHTLVCNHKDYMKSINISIFSKKRSELTREELKFFRQYDKDRYNNKRKKSRKDMTPEELIKAKKYDKKQKTLAEMTPEEAELDRKKASENNRQYQLRHPKTEEQKAAKREYDMKRNQQLTPEQKQKRNNSSKLSKQKSKERPETRYQYLKQQGKFYNLEVSLTFEEYSELISKPCFYCNNAMNTPSFGRGLDCINNNLGYTIDNVLPCCTTCNQTRSNKFTVEETRTMIQAVLTLRKLT